MKSMTLGLWFVFAAAMSPGWAQDGGCQDCPDSKTDGAKQDGCGAKDLMCPKAGACEGKCKEICDKVGATLKAVRARIGEKMQKELGAKCACTAGECTTADCTICETVKSKIFVPMMKERVSAAFKNLKKDVTHSVKGDDGKVADVTCTFLKGDTCKPCVEEMADAGLAKLKELRAEQKK